MKAISQLLIPVSAALLLVSCAKMTHESIAKSVATDDRNDYHSFGNPEQIRVTHVDLDLEVKFDQRVFAGSATLTLERAASYHEGPIVLDTRALHISRTESSPDLTQFAPCRADLGAFDPILGTPLTVQLPENAKFLRIYYSTSPESTGLQWLTPAQTASRKYPFLFSQSQAINARSWVPLQDSPGVRITYGAHIRTPKDLVAVMSAENDPYHARKGEYDFQMRESIPPYLLAIAVGDIDFRPLTKRTGVYAEREVVDRAAREFDDTQQMLEAAEELYGPYRWGRYDILVLPPSFPFGGMENPRLTFVTPALLAGDKSLVETITHELAHSWSGNLVTNATWRDFWLNEGITTYLSTRITEKVFGSDRADMEAALERGVLEREMQRLDPRDQILHIDLKGRNPDLDGMTDVPYGKGMLFMRLLEETYGRDRFDPFLRNYFQQFAFRSITTAEFVDFLGANLLQNDPNLARRIALDEWLNQPGLPAAAPKPIALAFGKVDDLAQNWMTGKVPTAGLPGKSWSTQEWLAFLRKLPPDVGRERMADLDRSFGLTKSGNAEITAEWLRMAVVNRYDPASPRMEQFLIGMGRRKYLDPIYTELAKTPEGKRRAQAIFAKARNGYHPLTVQGVEQILNGTAR